MSSNLTVPSHNLPRASLQTPVELPRLEKLWVASLGAAMQGAFYLMTVAADAGSPFRKDRIKTKVDTGETGKCRLLVYLPPGRNKSIPKSQSKVGVIVHLHGSGWTVGRPEFEHVAAARMARELGTVVVCPDYSKAPQHPYPFALIQLHSVLDWIAAGGLGGLIAGKCDVGLDSTRIAISGGSSGGNLAASLALLTQHRPLCNGARIVALGLMYPLLDAEKPFHEKLKGMNKKDIALPPWVSKFFLRAYLPPPRIRADPYVSPLRAPRAWIAELPPTAVVTASKDYLAAEGDEFARIVEKAGVETRHVRCEGVAHAFDLDPGFSRSQRRRNQLAVEQGWGTIIDVFKNAITPNTAWAPSSHVNLAVFPSATHCIPIRQRCIDAI